MAQHTNRLIHETSPYLRQHAHNPVDWYPWGEEALARARAQHTSLPAARNFDCTATPHDCVAAS